MSTVPFDPRQMINDIHVNHGRANAAFIHQITYGHFLGHTLGQVGRFPGRTDEQSHRVTRFRQVPYPCPADKTRASSYQDHAVIIAWCKSAPSLLPHLKIIKMGEEGKTGMDTRPTLR